MEQKSVLNRYKASRISKLYEGELWLHINNLEEQLNNIVISAQKDKDSLKKLKGKIDDYKCAIEYLISKTSKYGVQIETRGFHKHIIKNNSYNAWYKWWNDYFNSFTNDEAREFNDLLEAGDNVSKYRPDGNWQENIKNSKKGRK